MNDETTLDVMQDPIVIAAIEFMQDAHRNHALSPDPVLGGQRRKYSKAPYEVHPLQVGKMVARTIHNDAITVAVAIMHDVFEDTHKNAGDVRAFMGPKFGDDVAMQLIQGINEVTDVSQLSDGNRAVRKTLDKEHAWRAAPERQTVKLADMKSNMPSIVANDPGFARKWVAEKKDQWEGFTQGDSKLYEDMRVMFERYYMGMSVKEDDWELV